MFRHVHEMGTPAGVRAVIAEAFFRGRDIADALDPIPGHHAKALWVLLHHPPAFHTARLLLAAGSPAGRYWNLSTGFGGLPYELNGLIDRGFRLVTDPVTGIHGASIRMMRVMVKGSTRRVTLEAAPDSGPDDIYDMLDAHFPPARFPRSNLYVNQARFNVKYRAADDDRERSVTFEVTFPDGCDLKSKPDDQRAVGERCLRLWGILDDLPADGPARPGRVA